jgi:hypothetical protein
VSLSNSAGSSHLIADVTGFYREGSGYVPVDPVRLVDSRNGTGGVTGPVNGAVDIRVAGQVGLPASRVSSVVMNVTVTGPSQAGYATIWPTGTQQPLASNLNFTAGQTVANLVFAKLGTGGRISFSTTSATQLIIDVLGYHVEGSGYSPLTPARILDTRDGTGAPRGTVPGAGTIELQVTGRGGVPSTGATAVVMNVTATGPTQPGWITVWPTGVGQPLASNLNFAAGQTVPNLVIVPIGAGGKVSLNNGSSGATHLIADVQGWY